MWSAEDVGVVRRLPGVAVPVVSRFYIQVVNQRRWVDVNIRQSRVIMVEAMAVVLAITGLLTAGMCARGCCAKSRYLLRLVSPLWLRPPAKHCVPTCHVWWTPWTELCKVALWAF